MTPTPPEPHARGLPPYFASALTSLRPAWRETLQARGRRPLFSIAVFCSMLALSGVTLLRYALPGWGSSAQVRASGRAQVGGARQALPSEAALALQPHVVMNTRAWPDGEAAAPVDPAQERANQLLALRLQGERALVIRGDLREAEELFSRMLELEDGNARAAFGMARVRLAQGNLSGAEGWIQLAISKRPRRAPYHALYAEILTELGREEEALEERLRAAGGGVGAEGSDRDDPSGAAVPSPSTTTTTTLDQ
jgi:tetratricopeptide (TPR) repeat protein